MLTRRQDAAPPRPPMTFLLYSEVDVGSIESALGRPDYSYHFVLQGFRSALELLGSTILVRSLAEVDEIHDAEREAGRNCVFLCFTPPHKAPILLRCPTICVFAWEFSNIPNELLDDDSRSDWRTVFARHGAAITLSEHAAACTRTEMGSDFPIAAIAVPLAPRLAAIGQRRAGMQGTIALRGGIYDSRAYGPYFERPDPLPPAPVAPPRDPAPPVAPETPPAKSRLRTSIGVSRYYGLLWYRAAIRDLLLPRAAASVIARVGRGYNRTRLLLRPPPAPPPPPPPPPAPPPAEPAARPVKQVTLGGVVYTAVFNPADGRKNWHDMLTAFCWAFRDTPDATLVMKMVHHDRHAFEGSLAILIRQLQPFRCRVVALHGWLDDTEYDALVSATDFYVNTSSCEGLCLPLMEFMSAGRPAISPDHTAMADYVTDANSFVLRYGVEYNVWPHDPRDLFRTMRHRLEWDSLMEAYRASYRVARSDPARYGAMAEAARNSMRETCSLPVVAAKLEDALGLKP